eukprot:2242717-Amphidinium_carterae.1
MESFTARVLLRPMEILQPLSLAAALRQGKRLAVPYLYSLRPTAIVEVGNSTLFIEQRGAYYDRHDTGK